MVSSFTKEVMIMITMLPVFKGYTIDVRLKQIRRVY